MIVCFHSKTAAYLGPCQTSMMEIFEKIVHTCARVSFFKKKETLAQVLTFFAKHSIRDVWQGPKYMSVDSSFYGSKDFYELFFTALLVLVKYNLKLRLSLYDKKYLLLLHPHSPETVLYTSNKMPQMSKMSSICREKPELELSVTHQFFVTILATSKKCN